MVDNGLESLLFWIFDVNQRVSCKLCVMELNENMK